MDTTDMTHCNVKFNNKSVDIALSNLRAHGFEVRTFERASQIADFVLSAVGSDKQIGFGGSITTEQLGLYDKLSAAGNICHFHWKVPKQERAAVIDKARMADFYIMSSNAVSEDGAILNIDGNGNRVGSLLNGPRQVFILLGENKFTTSRESAMLRVKTIACPANAKRLNLRTPCAITGNCVNCNSPERMCNYIVWTERPRRASKVYVCVAAENLGY